MRTLANSLLVKEVQLFETENVRKFRVTLIEVDLVKGHELLEIINHVKAVGLRFETHQETVRVVDVIVGHSYWVYVSELIC